ncbi:MAG: double zinc ribbon domain-containing protein, partial [Candidatus Zixiibacteriota bacterium]
MDYLNNFKVSSALNNILDFVYPPVCFGCDTIIDGKDNLVCNACWSKSITYDFPFCSICRDIMENGFSCQHCKSDKSLPVFSLGQYVNPLKQIIHRFKYNDYEIMGQKLG